MEVVEHLNPRLGCNYYILMIHFYALCCFSEEMPCAEDLKGNRQSLHSICPRFSFVIAGIQNTVGGEDIIGHISSGNIYHTADKYDYIIVYSHTKNYQSTFLTSFSQKETDFCFFCLFLESLFL